MSKPTISRVTDLPLCELGEAPHWDKESKSLLYVDAFQSKIYRYFPDSGKHQVLTLKAVSESSGDSVTFVIPVEGEPDLFLISVGRDIGLIRWSPSDPVEKTTTLTSFSVVDQDRPTNRLNDGKCDSKGRLWAGTKGVETSPGVIEKERGNLFLFSTSLEQKLLADKINLSNGLTWSSDNKTFYYIDTVAFSVDAFDFDSPTDTIKNRRKLVDYKTVGLTDDCPDGMTIDTEGKLWVANYLGSKIIQIDPVQSKIIRTIEMPITNPTCCAWGGENFDELYVTSSQFKFTEEELKDKPDSGAVFKITGLGAKGFPPNKAKISLDLMTRVPK